MDHEVFISYPNEDEAIARAVVDAFRAKGISSWAAFANIRPGQHYLERIVAGIDHSRMMLLIFTRHTPGSAFVLKEIEQATKRRMPILNFRADDTAIPATFDLLLSTYQWMDATQGGALELHLPKLVDAVHELLSELPPANPVHDVRPSSVPAGRSATPAPAPVPVMPVSHPVLSPAPAPAPVAQFLATPSPVVFPPPPAATDAPPSGAFDRLLASRLKPQPQPAVSTPAPAPAAEPLAAPEPTPAPFSFPVASPSDHAAQPSMEDVVHSLRAPKQQSGQARAPFSAPKPTPPPEPAPVYEQIPAPAHAEPIMSEPVPVAAVVAQAAPAPPPFQPYVHPSQPVKPIDTKHMVLVLVSLVLLMCVIVYVFSR